LGFALKGKRPPKRWPFSYFWRFEDMQAAINKAYDKRISRRILRVKGNPSSLVLQFAPTGVQFPAISFQNGDSSEIAEQR
jgi:hypothetical protein